MSNDPQTVRAHQRFASETIPNILLLCEAIEYCPSLLRDPKCISDIGRALTATVTGQAAIRKLPAQLQIEFGRALTRLLTTIGVTTAPAPAEAC